MAQCLYCGAELAAHERFCGICGRFQKGPEEAQEATLRSNADENRGVVTPPNQLPASVQPTAGPMPDAGLPPGIPGYDLNNVYNVYNPYNPYNEAPVAVPPPPPAQSGLTPGPSYYGYLGQGEPIASTVIAAGRAGRPWIKTTAGKIVSAAILLVILVAGGLVAYLFLGLQPLLTVSSAYHVGSTPAGAFGTSFQVSGQHFAANALVSFQLDGKALPGALAHSDDQGNLRTTLVVTSAWPLGRHTLTAIDAANNRTRQGVVVQILPQGMAHTPGPNGAPPDDASFTLNVQAQGVDADGQPQTGQLVLVVTGHPDPAGGSVCGIDSHGFRDDGQAHSFTETDTSGQVYKRNFVTRCQGSYHNGQLTYTRIFIQNQVMTTTMLGTVTCTAATPYNGLLIQGSFTSPQTASGIYSSPAIKVSCDDGNTIQVAAVHGTWTGQLA
jgi:hypothetical protein